MTRKNNSCVCVCVCVHSTRKEGRHWSDLSLLRDSLQRGSEALLISEGLSDLSGGDS